MISLNIL